MMRLRTSSTSTITSTETNETTSLLHHDEENIYQTYKRRWYILALFCLLGSLTTWQWNTWGPISESLLAAYGWDSSRVALFANLGTGVFVICVWPVCWGVEVIGLRSSILLTCVCTTVALALRCISQDTETFTWLCFVSAVLIGMSLTLIMAVPPLIAVDWFPSEERAQAQAYMFASEQLGLVVSYLEPLFIRLPAADVAPSMIRNDIAQLMYYSTGVSAAVALLCFIYFPSRPPVPPTHAASISADNVPFLSSVLQLVSRGKFLVVLACYFICTGPSFGWQTVLNFSLLPLGIHQNEAMVVGLTAILCSSVAAVVSGRYTDRNCGKLRRTLVVLLLLSSGSYYWFLLQSEGTIPFQRWQVYTSVVLAISLNYACLPVMYEMVSELSHPCPAVLVGGILATADNISASIFLAMYQVFNTSFSWVPYVLVASCALVVLPIQWTAIDYNRSVVDNRMLEPPSQENNSATDLSSDTATDFYQSSSTLAEVV